MRACGNGKGMSELLLASGCPCSCLPVPPNFFSPFGRKEDPKNFSPQAAKEAVSEPSAARAACAVGFVLTESVLEVVASEPFPSSPRVLPSCALIFLCSKDRNSSQNHG